MNTNMYTTGHGQSTSFTKVPPEGETTFVEVADGTWEEMFSQTGSTDVEVE